MKLIAKSALAILGMSLVVSACGGGKDDDGGSGGGDNGAAGSGSDGTGGTDDGSPEPDPDDKTSPTLVSTTPENGATKVEAGITLTLTFSEAMDKSATADAISIVRTDGDTEAEPFEIAVKSVVWDKAGTVATVTVDAIEMLEVLTADALPYTYTVSISNVAADVSGNYLDDTKFSFSTLREVTQEIPSEFEKVISYASSGQLGSVNDITTVGCWGTAGARSALRGWVAFPIGSAVIPSDAQFQSASLVSTLTEVPGGTSNTNLWAATGKITIDAKNIANSPTLTTDWWERESDDPNWSQEFTSTSNSTLTADLQPFSDYVKAKFEAITDDTRLEFQYTAQYATTTGTGCTDKNYRFQVKPVFKVTYWH